MKTIAEFDLFLRSTVLKSKFEFAGWDVAFQDASSACTPQTFIYVYDHLSGWTWLAGINRQSFQDMATIGESLSPTEADLARGALLGTVAAMKTGDQSKMNEAERCLGYSVALYAGGTATFHAAHRFSGGGHFCVVLYRSKRDPTIANLRPFAIPSGDGEALKADEFKAFVHRVVERDRLLNPQWLAC
jgi:hypothetical protein